MRARGLKPFRAEPDQPGLDHSAPRAERAQAVTAGEQPADARAATDATAIEPAIADRSLLRRTSGRGNHGCEIAPRPFAAAKAALLAKPGGDVIFVA